MVRATVLGAELDDFVGAGFGEDELVGACDGLVVD